MLYGLGMRLFRNEEDTLDFCQDVYVKALENRHSFEGRSKFSTWLYSLALNTGLNILKKSKRLVQVEDVEIFSKNITYGEDDILRQITDEEMKQEIRNELEKLPDAYRIPLILFYYEKLPYDKIAKELSIKEGTLKSYIFRGKQILKEKLKARGY